MTNPTWFNKAQYLDSKLAQLIASGDTRFSDIVALDSAIEKAGFTAYSHFESFSLVERTAPNSYFNAAEYLEAKAKQANAEKVGGKADWNSNTIALAIKDAGFATLWDHFAQFGWKEGVNPSNAFDISAYFDAKLAQLKAAEPTANWTLQTMKAAFESAGLDPVTHALTFGVKENVAVAVVPDAEKVVATGGVPTNAGKAFALTTGIDNIVGTAGNDTLTAVVDASLQIPVTTLTALDVIDGGAGADVMNLNALTAVAVMPAVTVSNIETLNIRAAAGFTADVSGFTGLTAANVTQAAAALSLTAAATTALSISGAVASVATTGGSSVTLAKAMKNVAAGGVTIDKTGAVTVTATDSDAAAGDIVIGGTTAVTGAVAVNSTGAKIVGGTGAVVLDDIKVTGGTTVSVTQAATADMGNVATKGVVGDVVTQGAVTVVGGSATTAVTVTQGDQVTAKAAVAGVTGVSATQVVTFVDMLAGETVTVDGLTFTASKALTAAQAAAAFAGLTASDTQAAGASANGAYTGVTTANWTSGAASGKTVTFSEKVAGSGAAFVVADAVAASNVTVAPAVTGVANMAAVTGVLGVANGAVKIDDNATAATIKTVAVNGYDAGATLGGTNALNALTSLSLANSGAGAAAVTTNAAVLDLTVNDVTAAVTLTDASLKTLNITTAAKDSSFVLNTVTTVEALNIAGTNAVNLGATNLSALKTVTVSGSAGLTVDASAATVTSVTTTATTGSVTATIDSTKATYTGGAGRDNVTLSNATATAKAIDLGAGNDSLKLANGTVAIPTVAVAGGDGTDTLSMTVASAAITGLSGSTAFGAKVTGFEALTINDIVGADATVDLAALGAYNFVTTSGVGATFGLTLDKMASGGTVVLTAPGTVAAGDGVIVKVTDAALAANTTDVLNVVAVSAGPGTLAVGQVTAAGVETVNITSTDSKLDDNGDGVNDAVVTHTLTLSDAAVTTINVTGNANLTLTNTDNVALAMLDASTGFTGALNATTNGTVAQTIKGGSGNDVLVAKAGNLADTLIGGAGNDTLTANSGLTTLTGGAGADTFVITAPSLNATSFSTITDLSLGDVIQIAGANKFAASKVALDPSVSVFQDYANAAMNATATNEVSWFQSGGNTYVVMDKGADSVAFVNGQDVIVKLTGSIDLSTASFSASNGAIEIV